MATEGAAAAATAEAPGISPAAEAIAVPAPAAVDAEAVAPPPAKKAKTDSAYHLNINAAVDKAYEGKSLHDLCGAPTAALQGIAERGEAILAKLHVKTVRELGGWKYYKIAKAIVGLAALEQPDRREAGAALNINKALDKAHETKPLKEVLALPPSALQGLADWVDAELADLGITSIEKLGGWKFAHWAECITQLSEYENTDFSSA
eukprot:NODE_14286_length_1117_cov_10.147475.p1 GENE.NODE_14286_length_1117_cov_10.147475~~NODE_14286_length_1117_cov_10.147475.p1  ORF type:complete len:206 (-),score=71.51 NODE_14286_length_1117_cov_10.147475:411-1028(-)